MLNHRFEAAISCWNPARADNRKPLLFSCFFGHCFCCCEVLPNWQLKRSDRLSIGEAGPAELRPDLRLGGALDRPRQLRLAGLRKRTQSHFGSCGRTKPSSDRHEASAYP